jgi:deoxyribose-phosphate aldolase
VKAGAREIDIVISRRHVLTGNWQALYDEMRDFRAACGDAHVKAILATGELGTLRNVARASLICMMAGADFIKTSTGKESVNATLPVTLTMVRAIRAYQAATGFKVGYKPAGGISKAKDALVYMAMMKEELGDRWLRPDLFRFGASSLLGDIERQLEHHATGAYSASYRHPVGDGATRFSREKRHGEELEHPFLHTKKLQFSFGTAQIIGAALLRSG